MSLGIFSFDLNAWLDSIGQYLDSIKESMPANDVRVNVAGFESGGGAGVFDDEAVKRALESSVTPIIALPPEVPVEVPVEVPIEKSVERAPPPPPSSLSVQPVVIPRPSLSPEARLEFERMMRALQTQVVANYRDADIADQDFGKRYVENFPQRKSFGDDEATDARRRDVRRDDERAGRVRSDRLRTPSNRA